MLFPVFSNSIGSAFYVRQCDSLYVFFCFYCDVAFVLDGLPVYVTMVYCLRVVSLSAITTSVSLCASVLASDCI